MAQAQKKPRAGALSKARSQPEIPRKLRATQPSTYEEDEDTTALHTMSQTPREGTLDILRQDVFHLVQQVLAEICAETRNNPLMPQRPTRLVTPDSVSRRQHHRPAAAAAKPSSVTCL
jgi:hypothetical protein